MPMLPRRKEKTADSPEDAAEAESTSAKSTSAKSATASGSAKPAVTKRTTSGRVTPKSTGRYTAPLPKTYHRSPTWVPVLMLTLMLAGMIIIISNYFPSAGFLPGDSNNWYLLTGLGLITAGFITATKWH